MKKFLTLIFALLLPLATFAQAEITTKKNKISDFTEKITKVVLTGDVLFDACLKDEISARWRVSPYEFCTLKEFNEHKGNDNYYFLISTKGQFKTEGEPGIRFLTLVKGGSAADNGINQMLEIVSLPIASAEDPSGRELTYLPAFITIIQKYTLDSIDHDLNAYVGLSNYTKNLADTRSKNIAIAETDLDAGISQEEKEMYLINGLGSADENTVDKHFTQQTPNTVVSYVAAPSSPHPGSYCYKMLIDTQTYQLYFFRKHRITSKTGAGFANYDLRSLSLTRKDKKKK